MADVQTSTPETSRPVRFTRTYWFAGFFIGVALAGFFDGILLHQILQWHSLLSSLEGEIFQDLRFRILMDGVFHVAMYAIGAIGLWLLWQSRAQFSAPGSGRRFASTLFIGFGAWHLLDAVLNHWILGLHHIKENDPNWLAWDLAFFCLGLVSTGIGLLLHYRTPGNGNGRRLGGAVAATFALLLVASGVLGASPLRNTQSVTVVFKQGVASTEVFTALRSVDGRMVWANPEGDVWRFQVESNAAAWQLYAHGAIFVSGSFFGMGCFSA